jgi:hypothetical protein
MKTATVFENGLTSRQIELFKKIKRKGRDQQEIQYLFPSLYGSNAVTRQTKGIFASYERIERRCYIKYI